MTTRRDFTTSALAIGLAGPAVAAWPGTDADAAPPRPQSLRLPLWIDGRGPLSFIVDTGASRSVLAAHALPELARSTRREDQVRLQTSTGVVDVPTVAIDGLATTAGPGGVSLGARRLPVLPRHALSSADGLVGADVMAGCQLRLDFVTGSASLTRLATGATRPADAARGARAPWRASRPTAVAVEFDAVGRPFVEVALGRRRVRALLDTGALRSIADRTLQPDLGAAGAAASLTTEPPSTGLRGADGSALQATEGALPALRLGARRWPAGPALFAPLPAAALAAAGMAGKPVETRLLLGLDRLAALEWLELDYAAARLTLSPLRAGRE